jgi:hypothetical protein
MQRFLLVVLLALLVTRIPAAHAAPNFLGQSGNIVTPDDLVVPQGEFSVGYHFLEEEIFGGGDSMNIFSANYGFTRAFEAGVTYVSRDDDDLLVNAKYQLVRERRNAPSVTVGVVDLLDQLDKDPGLFLLIGKNLTGASRDVATETRERALHGYIGAGTGPYEGLLAGLDYNATPQLSLMAEFAPEGPLTGRDDAVNVGLRYAISNRVRLDAALFDWDNFGVGISFSSGLGRR